MHHYLKVLILCIAVITSFADDHKEKEKPGHYQFEYGVHDPHTHDIKTHKEHRDGHSVSGVYTIKEPDGTTRIVEYTGDHHGGIQAIVKRLGHAHHPAHYGKHSDGHKEEDSHSKEGGSTSYVGTTHFGYHKASDDDSEEETST